MASTPKPRLSDPMEVEEPRQRVFSAYTLPLIGFVIIAIALGVGLTLNPKEIPSALIGQKISQFSLPPVQGRTLGLSDDVLIGEVSLVNVFASWCLACRQEHPLLMRLAKRNIVPIHGLNYKDRPEDAEKWLNDWGDPYTRTGADRKGRVAIDWGVYGVPETFIIDKKGQIAYKHIGPISREILDKKLLPFVSRLQKKNIRQGKGAGHD